MISSVRFCARNICQKNIRNYNNLIQNSKNSEARLLGRMLTKLKRKKNSNFQKQSLLKVSYMEPDNNDNNHRKEVALNKVYMEHMTELIQNGSVSSKILKQGLEILRVRLTKRGEYLNIYWACHNENLTEEAITEILQPATKELQEQMGSIRYVSKTPFVRFVRDLKFERAQTVERLLKTADFGTHLEPDHSESDTPNDWILCEEGLPEMRQDVFGVNHAKIKAKILAAMESQKLTHTPKENEFAVVEMENLIPFDKKTFAKFYKRKRILDRKLTSRGLFGWSRFEKYEEVEEENDDDNLANELWEEIRKEQMEEEKECARDYEY